jgi:hypothetical protein
VGDEEYAKVYKHVRLDQMERAKQQSALEKNNSLMVKNGATRTKMPYEFARGRALVVPVRSLTYEERCAYDAERHQ